MKCDYCNKEIINLKHVIHYKEDKTLSICTNCASKLTYLSDYVPVIYYSEINTVHTYTDIKQPKDKKYIIKR